MGTGRRRRFALENSDHVDRAENPLVVLTGEAGPNANRRLTRRGFNVPHRQAPAFTRRRAAANATHHWVRRATLKQRGGPAGLFKRVNSQELAP